MEDDMAEFEESIKRRVINCIVDNLNLKPEDITPESKLEDDLGLDSLEIMELSFALEEEFATDIEDEVIFAWKTVGDIMQWVTAEAL